MNANQVKENLSVDDIVYILNDLDANPIIDKDIIKCRTICHDGDSHKLIYYIRSNSFTCFTGGCGTFDIYALLMRILKLEFYDAFKYICSMLNIDTYNMLYMDPKNNALLEVFDPIIKKDKVYQYEELEPYDPSILNCFKKIYHHSWISDGISVEVMKKFQIMFNILDNQIIIPHYCKDGDLIGVRVRNLNKRVVEQGKKYMPLIYNRKLYNHATGSNLYGLNENIDHIKKHRKIIIVESEKSVMQINAMFPNMSIAVAVCGSNLTPRQIELIKELDIDEVIIAMDKEFLELGDKNDKFYRKKIGETFLKPLKLYYNMSVIWDVYGLLDFKDAPSDKGKEIFEKLFKNRIMI